MDRQMAKDASSVMRITELEAHSGVPRRTIRLYISRGLLAGPLKSGRDAVYGKEHLNRLLEIRKLQSDGLTLREIALALSGTEAQETLPRPTSYWSYPLSDDVVVLMRTDVSPWRGRHIKSALNRLAAEIAGVKKGGSDDEVDG
jgi:DNA-binding transcriptional MerR regulator